MESTFRRLIKKRLKGGFTIEAALLLPLTMILIASIMIIVFVLHDRVILSSVSLYEVMEKAEQYKADGASVSEEIESMLKKRLIIADEAAVSEEEKEGEVQLAVAAKITIPLWAVRLLTGDSRQLSSQLSITNLNSREILIRYKTICDGLDMLTEGDGADRTSEQGETGG